MDAQSRHIKQDPLIAQMGNTVQLQNVSINIKFLFLRCNKDKAQAKITEKTQTEIEG